MTATRQPRYRVCVYELRDGNTTQVINAYGTGFTTAVATLQGDDLEIHFGESGPRHLKRHITAATADEHSPAADANSIPEPLAAR